jgi:hypothetical protein
MVEEQAGGGAAEDGLAALVTVRGRVKGLRHYQHYD